MALAGARRGSGKAKLAVHSLLAARQIFERMRFFLTHGHACSCVVVSKSCIPIGKVGGRRLKSMYISFQIVSIGYDSMCLFIPSQVYTLMCIFQMKTHRMVIARQRMMMCIHQVTDMIRNCTSTQSHHLPSIRFMYILQLQRITIHHQIRFRMYTLFHKAHQLLCRHQQRQRPHQ